MRRAPGGTENDAPPDSVQLLLFGGSEALEGEPLEGEPLEEGPETSEPSTDTDDTDRGDSGAQDRHVPPIDEADRELVATALEETVFAVAGAGSGKTRHLVERVVNVILSGSARIDEIAVITFTEAAAGELRERIGEALDDVVTAPKTPRSDPFALQRAQDALSSLDAAAITTLHGFARRILSAHPFDAGLPPTFDVLDQARSLADLDEHWVDTVDALLADERRARAVQWGVVAGADLGKLRAIVRRMGENWDRLEQPHEVGDSPALPRLDAAPVVDALRGALALADWCTEPGDKLLAHLESLRPYAAHLEHAGTDELQLLRLLVRPPRTISGRSKGTAAAWNGHKPDVIALLDEAHAAREAMAAAAVGAAMAVVGAALAELAVAAARRRQREGRLQFHDLLVLACELVRDHPDVRATLHEEYRHIFVDEYQDTDPLQAELVTMIAAAPHARVGEVAWWELDTTPGALFFVGDPLQSIYAFRRADVGTFLRTLSHVATQEAHLVTNFRSVPGIVEWINAVFSRVIGTQEGLDDQPTYSGSHAARRAQPVPPRGVTVVGAGDDHDLAAAATRATEAEDVAAVLARAVNEGWPVGAGGRPVQLDDIAVLVPTRTSVPALESAFDDAGIDYRLESSSLVYDTREVQELLQVLRAVDDPSDSASVVAALRTPGFGCGDDDLLRHKLAGGSWDYRQGVPATVGPDDPVRLGLVRLHALHEARTWTGVSELVDRVLDETRQFCAALDGRRWREEWRRLRFVADQARQFAETSPGTLRQYLAWVDVQRDEDAKVTEVILPEADVPAVSIMTIHAAKGLEFPVVAVVGLGANPQGVTAPTVLFGQDGIELAVNKAVCTARYDEARLAEQRILERERLRLLYVALTRAENHLVVSVHRPQRIRTSIAESLEAVLWDVQHLWDDAGPRPQGAPGAQSFARPRAAPLPPPAGGEDDAVEFARWRLDRERRLAARPSVVSATAVAKLAAARARPDGANGPDGVSWPDEEPDEEPDDDAGTVDSVDGEAGAGAGASDPRTLWRRGRAGTALGRAVHSVLQTVDLRTGDGVDAMAQVHAAREGVPGRWSEVATLARTALESQVVRTAVQGRFWRELYVGVPFADGVLEGFVDLLFEGPEGLEVVDYKTDRVRSDAEVDRLASRYRLQGAAYAAAVGASTGRPVRRCTFLFLRGEEAVAKEVDDLEGAIAEVYTAVTSG